MTAGALTTTTSSYVRFFRCWPSRASWQIWWNSTSWSRNGRGPYPPRRTWKRQGDRTERRRAGLKWGKGNDTDHCICKRSSLFIVEYNVLGGLQIKRANSKFLNCFITWRPVQTRPPWPQRGCLWLTCFCCQLQRPNSESTALRSGFRACTNLFSRIFVENRTC